MNALQRLALNGSVTAINEVLLAAAQQVRHEPCVKGQWPPAGQPLYIHEDGVAVLVCDTADADAALTVAIASWKSRNHL